MSGMECASYGSAEEGAFVTGVAASLGGGVGTEHIGGTECADETRRRRHRELRSRGRNSGADEDGGRRLDTAVSIAFDISIQARSSSRHHSRVRFVSFIDPGATIITRSIDRSRFPTSSRCIASCHVRRSFMKPFRQIVARRGGVGANEPAEPA